MSDIKIQDNFLSSIQEFRQLQELFSPDRKRKIRCKDKEIGHIPWNFGTIHDLEAYPVDDPVDDMYNYQLCYHIYHASSPNVGIDPIVEPSAHSIIPLFFSKIRTASIMRIKANLVLKTSEIIPHIFHVDCALDDEGDSNSISALKTSIYYINSNDGYTEFEDGTRIESVANRLITFPYHYKHRGTTCTNKPYRMVINFNYF